MLYPSINVIRTKADSRYTIVIMTGSLRGAYVVFIILLAVNIVLISVLNTKKYNLDYAKEEEVVGTSKDVPEEA